MWKKASAASSTPTGIPAAMVDSAKLCKGSYTWCQTMIASGFTRFALHYICYLVYSGCGTAALRVRPIPRGYFGGVNSIFFIAASRLRALFA